MIICPYCRQELLEGTLFCPECGASLADEKTRPQPEPPPAPPVAVPVVLEPASGAAGGKTTAHITPTQLRMLVLNSGRTIPCPYGEVLLVGRSDPSGGTFPEVDLGQDNGYMAGVSRRHARIIRRGDDFYVEDLNSMNGTFLNRNKLPAHTPVPFQDGDEIRLGNLVLRVIIEEIRP
jgi:pSer/pThr/pTyr-binding forkhead associated (FHA) protein